MPWHARSAASLVAFACLCTTLRAEESRFAETNSRSDYVHWIDLYDASNRRIDPSDPAAGPYSPVTTCGRCHDYKAIAGGHHFNAPRSGVAAGRPGEPWIWVDERTGTELPLSYRGWEGTYDPRQLGITERQFVLKFGRHLPGGGPGEETPAADAADAEPAPAEAAEPAPAEAAEPAPAEAADLARWKLSGWLHVDCMFCHAGQPPYTPELWWEQIQNENFAWAQVAAAGLAEVEGKVSGLPDDFDPAAAQPGGRNQLPRTTYANLRMNASKQVFFDVVRTPDNDACYYCHTTRPVGPQIAPAWTHDEDVHLRAGMSCSDCHRNGIEHHTVRGFEGEEHPTGQSVATLTCRGCHVGEAGAGGRLGAPVPLHRGLPAFHLELLSCTSCHSGPVVGPQALRVQTSLAHGLGLPAHDYTADKAPGIVAPVLLQDGGTLYPHRMMWPAFWGRLSGETLVPLHPEAAYEALRRVLRVRRGETLMKALSEVKLSKEDKVSVLGEERAAVDEAELTEEEQAELAALTSSKALEAWQQKLAEALQALKELVTEGGAEPVYVAGGKAFRLAEDGTVAEFQHPAADPYAWKLAHDVRPAFWASGATGCFDCHASGTAIFEGQVAAVSPVPDPQPITRPMYELAGYDKRMQDAWNSSFQGRPMFKYAGLAAMGVVALVLLTYAIEGLRGLIGLFRRA